MILIDRANEEQSIILTDTHSSFDLTLQIKNDATRETADIELGTDLSENPERYQNFNLPTEAFEDLPEGYYSYSVAHVSSETIYSVGKLYIKPAQPISNITVPEVNPGDNIIIL